MPVLSTTAPQGCTHFKLRSLMRRVGRHYDHAMAGTGLKLTQYSLLSHLWHLAPVRPADLAQRMAMASSTLSRNLQPLLVAGYVAVRPGSDARSHELVLTPAGSAKRQEAQRRWKAAQQALNGRLGAATVAALHTLIDDALTRLQDGGDAGDDAAT